MFNWKAILKPADRASILKHTGLLAYAFIASILFKSLGFIPSHQVPVTMLIAFVSPEWMFFQRTKFTSQ